MPFPNDVQEKVEQLNPMLLEREYEFKKIKKETAQAMTVLNEKVVKENIEIKEEVKDS